MAAYKITGPLFRFLQYARLLAGVDADNRQPTTGPALYGGDASKAIAAEFRLFQTVVR